MTYKSYMDRRGATVLIPSPSVNQKSTSTSVTHADRTKPVLQNMFLHFPAVYVALSLLSSALHVSEGVWQCSTSATREKNERSGGAGCKPRFDNPPELDVLVQQDPAAAYKYNFECVDIKALQEHATEDGRHELQLRQDSDKCEITEETMTIAGTRRMALGHNVVTDKQSFDTASTVILDVVSSTHFSASVKEPVKGTCYKVPDAFVSSESFGIYFESFSSGGFKGMGASTVEEQREKQGKARSAEFSLSVEGYGMGAEAAFSHSDTTNKLEDMKQTNSEDKSETHYLQYSHKLHIHRPKPTNEIIAEWKTLHRKNTKEAYFKYFQEFGTHYHVSACVGGKYTAVFTTKKSNKQTHTSDSQARADCISAKVSGSYGGVTAAASASYCDSAYSEDAKNMTAEELISERETTCIGGDGNLCPGDLNSPEKFEAWKQSIETHPALILGNKVWIPQLIDHVLSRARDLAGEEGDMYRDVVRRFEQDALISNEPAAAGTQSLNFAPMEAFRASLHRNLELYLEANSYCNKPNACKPVFTEQWIEGPSKAVHGTWGKTAECEHGLIVKAITRETGWNHGDKSGLDKLVMRCGKPEALAATTDKLLEGGVNWDNDPQQENLCTGYFSGYKLWSWETGKAGWDVGAADIQFECKYKATDGERAGHWVIEEMPTKQHIINFQRTWPKVIAAGVYEHQWIQCPSQFAICGMNTKVRQYKKGDDGSSINNVQFKCCYVGELK